MVLRGGYCAIGLRRGVVLYIHQQAARWVGQFQITQETRERVVLRVAPRVPPTAEEVAALEDGARAKLGAGTDFHLLLVPEIPIEINGKFRLSRSFVQSDYDHPDWDRRRADDIASLGRLSPAPRGASRG